MGDSRDAAVGEYKYECSCTLVAFTREKTNTIIFYNGRLNVLGS